VSDFHLAATPQFTKFTQTAPRENRTVFTSSGGMQKRKRTGFLHVLTNGGEPCIDRGTAQWEGDAFVNNYYFEAGGKHIRAQDTFTFTSSTHTLVAEIESGRNGRLTTLITTRATRP